MISDDDDDDDDDDGDVVVELVPDLHHLSYLSASQSRLSAFSQVYN